MGKVDRILELLAADRAWHSVDELAHGSGLSRLETVCIVDFLSTHEFVLLNTKSKKARIKEDVNRFLERTRERANALAAVPSADASESRRP